MSPKTPFHHCILSRHGLNRAAIPLPNLLSLILFSSKLGLISLYEQKSTQNVPNEQRWQAKHSFQWHSALILFIFFWTCVIKNKNKPQFQQIKILVIGAFFSLPKSSDSDLVLWCMAVNFHFTYWRLEADLHLITCMPYSVGTMIKNFAEVVKSEL